MTDLRDAARQALNSLRGYRREIGCEQPCDAERALEAALKQPEQEPVAWLESPYGSIKMNTTMRFQFPPRSLKWKIPLYTHPPRCPNCASLAAQNTEQDRVLCEMEHALNEADSIMWEVNEETSGPWRKRWGYLWGRKA